MLRPPDGRGQTPRHLAPSAEKLTRKDRTGDQQRQDACTNHIGSAGPCNVHLDGLVEEDSKGPDGQETSDEGNCHTDAMFFQFWCEIMRRTEASNPAQNPP